MNVFDSLSNTAMSVSEQTEDTEVTEQSLPTSSKTSQIKSRTRTAKSTWQHSREPRGDEPERNSSNHRIFYCKYCDDFQTTASTTFRNHLLKRHEITVQSGENASSNTVASQIQQLYTRAESANTEARTEISSQVLQSILNKDVISEALISLIVVRNLPFRLVEWPEFQALVQLINPESKNYFPKSHTEIPKKIQQSFLSQKDIVRKKLQSAISSIHISLDIWTSPNNLLFLGVCGHFVEYNQDKVSKALLALQTVASHSGEEQFATLLPVLQEYEIIRKLGSVVSDNATTNDKLCRTISKHLLEEEKIEWDPSQRRIRCLGHIINLAVQAFIFYDSTQLDECEAYDKEEQDFVIEEDTALQKRNTFRMMGAIGKLHNIVVHVRGSAGRTKEFKNLAGRTVPLDNRTRWNSWYGMLQVAHECHAAIDTYTKNHFDTLEADYLYPYDWENLRTIHKFLRPFSRATLMAQGQQATIDRVLFTMDILIRHFQRSLVSFVGLSFFILFVNIVS